jgi:hypothetical protein
MTKDVINLTTAYIYDADLRIEANRQGKNYWYEYIKEINEQLGLRAEEMSRNSLENAEVLGKVSILFIGDLTEAQITGTMKSNLDEWVKSGGVLIGFGTDGLDEIFGNSCDSITRQPENDYAISGYFDLKPDPLTTHIHSYLHPEQKLIIFSNIRNISTADSTEIARLYRVDGTDTGYAAITKRDYHNGHAYYFAFNVPQTIWVLHQGIPITYDRDGDGYYRTGDLIAIGNNEREVLYADEILFLIQNMLAQKPQPLIYQMPPINNPLAPFIKGDNPLAPSPLIPLTSPPLLWRGRGGWRGWGWVGGRGLWGDKGGCPKGGRGVVIRATTRFPMPCSIGAAMTKQRQGRKFGRPIG